MPVKMRRRRVKKRKRPGEFSRVKFAVFIAIMVLAVFLGYLTAKFVIGPLLGYNADESPIKIAGEDKKASSGDGSDSSSDDGSSGDTEKAEAASQMANDLTEKGIEAKVIEDEDMYKVISPVIKTKDEAIDQLNDAKDKEVEDVFIASF